MRQARPFWGVEFADGRMYRTVYHASHREAIRQPYAYPTHRERTAIAINFKHGEKKVVTIA